MADYIRWKSANQPSDPKAPVEISVQQRDTLERELGRMLEYRDAALDGGLGGPGYYVFEGIRIYISR